MLTRALRIWADADDARAIHPDDHRAVRATEPARALVVELATAASSDRRDLFTAFATLGRLLFEAGATPSLASATVDGARCALAAIEHALDAETSTSARASLAEGYASALLASEREVARRAWEWPACVVPLDEDTCAITAGHPEGEGDALSGWAGRVAARAAKAGFRRAVVSGGRAARAELESALRLAGIEVTEKLPSRARGWLPWGRR